MVAKIRHFLFEIVGALILGLGVVWLTVGGEGNWFSGLGIEWSFRWLDVKTFFFSIVL
ncbi:permease, partial [Mesorhizobium sp. M00.F.Ca.ET.186.01.1.1]